MRIEEINAASLKEVDDQEVRNLRFRFVQLYGKNFTDPKTEQAGDLTRTAFLAKYVLLRNEMRRRALPIAMETPLDKEINDRIAKKALWNLDVPALGDLVMVENYVSVAGSFVKSPKEAKDLDVIIRASDKERNAGTELKLKRLLQKETGKEAHFVYEATGPHSSYIPLFDLVLRARRETKKVLVREMSALQKALTPAEKADFERESELIRENKKKPEASRVHKFKPAKWTHPNGHPRCLVCGDEENLSGLCNKEPTRKDLLANADRLKEGFGIDAEAEADALGLKKKALAAQTPEPDSIRERLQTLKKGFEIMKETEEEAAALGVKVIAENIVLDTAGWDEEIKKAGIAVGRPFTPLKTKGGYGELEFAQIDPLWETWARGYIPDPGIAVETKYDGFRVQLHRDGDAVKIFSEDAKRDLGPKLPGLVKEALSLKAEKVILDGELLLYVSGDKIARKDMATYLSAEPPEPADAVIHVFDCLYLGSPLDKESWAERQEALQNVFAPVDEKLLIPVKPTITRTEAAFKAAVKAHSEEKDSEGAMAKVLNSPYPLTGSTGEWAKFKNFKEVRGKVAGVETKEGGGFIYTIEIADGKPIGKTYATEIEAKEGDVLEIAVAEIKVSADGKFTWDNPIVRSLKPAGTALTTEAQARAFSGMGRTATRKAEAAAGEAGNVTFKQGDSGTGIAQVHIMGLTEEETVKLRDGAARVRVARPDPGKLKAVLLSLIGNAGAHVDMRLRPGAANYWEGNEIFTGNIENLDKLNKLGEQNVKLRSAWKVPHAGEAEGEIRGPLGWMEAGARGPEIFRPGEPGATAEKYGAMILIDRYKWDLYYMKPDRHAYKFHFDGGKYFDGNFLWAFVPTEAGRIWMVSRLDPEDNVKAQEEKKGAFFKILKVDPDKQIVGGVIYEPGSAHETDTQGDFTDAVEIQDAMYRFMEKYFSDHARIKVMHQGRTLNFPILECFQPEQDTKKGDQIIKAGSWWLMVKITDEEIWGLVKGGKLTGFSMGGTAKEAVPK